MNGKLMVNMLDGSGYFPDGEQLTPEEEKAFNHFIQLVEVTGISQSIYPEK
ncbi:hypothetical protein LLG07_04890 [bacterium]|nr:hypothetical protein [bacterium]